MKIFLAILVLISASATKAQTISPLTSEGSHKASGIFTLTNNTLQPLSVVLEPQSITLSKIEGKYAQSMRPLDSNVHLELSETSARLGPKEQHEFVWKLRCADVCNVAILSGMVVGHTQGDKDHPSIAVRIVLPHVIYAGCAKAQGCRKQQLDAAPNAAPDFKPTAPPIAATAAIAQKQ